MMKNPLPRARKMLSKEGLKKMLKAGKLKAVSIVSPYTFASKYRRFLSRKVLILSRSGLTKEQIEFVRQMSAYSYIGRMIGQTQILSIPARDKILSFLKANEEKIINSFSNSQNKTAPEAMHAINTLLKGFAVKEEVKEARYNEGAVERADAMLLGRVTKAKRVYVGRIALMLLGSLEEQYVKSVLGEKKFNEYAKEELNAHDAVFGKYYKGLLV